MKEGKKIEKQLLALETHLFVVAMSPLWAFLPTHFFDLVSFSKLTYVRVIHTDVVSSLP